MDDIKDIIKKYFPAPLSIPIGLQITILLGTSKINGLLQLVFPDLQKLNDKAPMLTITTTLALSCLLWVISYIVLYWKNRIKLKFKFGVYWDIDKNPYCPSCKIPLAGYTPRPPAEYFYWCHSHKANVFLHKDATPISLEEARKQL